MPQRRPIFTPDPRQTTVADVPWAPSYLGPRTVTRTTYRPADGRPSAGGLTISWQRGPDGRVRQYWSDGTPVSPEDFASQGEYWGLLGDEDRDRFDITTGQSQQRIDLEREASRKRIRQAARQIAEERRQYNLTREDRRREFDVSTGLDRDRLGADVLFRGAQLRGPRDAFQGIAYSRGVEAAGLSPYLASLTTGGTTAYGGGTATGGNPVPLTVGTMANQMAGQTGNAPGGQMNAAGNAATDAYGRPALPAEAQANLNAIDTVARRGLANLPLGSLENLSPSELDTFRSGLDYLGRDSDAELTFYRRSRPGQGNARSA